jgi:hypothetical protein
VGRVNEALMNYSVPQILSVQSARGTFSQRDKSIDISRGFVTFD